MPSGTVIDTISFSKIGDTVAVFETNNFLCYTDGSFLVDTYKEFLEFTKDLDSASNNQMACAKYFQRNFDSIKNQLSKSDTVFIKELDFSETNVCNPYQDLIRDLLEFGSIKIYNKKTKADEKLLIMYREHTGQKNWFDRFQTKDGEVIYKGLGTLDKF